MCLGVVFTSDGMWSEEIETRIGKSNAVLRELYRSVSTKRELSNIAKLSVFKSVFVLILTYGHVSCVMAERILTQVQAPNMAFLRRGHAVMKGRTGVRLRPGQETSLTLPYLNLSYFGSKCTALEKNSRHCFNVSAPPVIRQLGHCGPLVIPLELRVKVRSCKIRRALNVDPLLLIERT